MRRPESGVLESRDSGASWILVSSGTGSSSVRAVGVCRTGMTNVWAVAGRNLLMSRDAGKNWSSSPLSYEPRGSVHFHAADDSNFLLASDQGVFESRDGGQSWKQNSLPELLVENMAVAGDAVVVSTRSGNLYVSRDGGHSWTRTATNVDSADFSAVHAVTVGTSESIVAASATEGLFVVDLGARQSASVGQADDLRTPNVPASPKR